CRTRAACCSWCKRREMLKFLKDYWLLTPSDRECSRGTPSPQHIDPRNCGMLVDQFGFGALFFVLLDVGILEDASSAFSSQSPSFYVLHQKRSRTKLLAKSFVEVLEDVQPSVESNEIDQFKRSHWMIQL